MTPGKNIAPLDQQSLLVKALTSIASAILITDKSGRVIWLNEAFSRLSGYAPDELVGRTPAILKSGRQDNAFYTELWRTILSGSVWQSEMVNRRKDGSAYTVEEVITPLFGEDGDITHFIAIQHEINSRAQSQEREHYLAYHDPVTGLPNRMFFLSALDSAISCASHAREPLAALFLDLDHFKPVNDELGHQIGDELLVAVGERFQSAVRKGDVVARFGGDEFAILLSGSLDPKVVAALADKLVTTIAGPFVIRNKILHVGVSIGIAMYPVDALDAGTLLEHADGAMYDAKRAGGSRFRFFRACPMPARDYASQGKPSANPSRPG